MKRREFLKKIGAAGVGGALASGKAYADDQPKTDAGEPNKPAEPKGQKVPTRKLGKIGVDVPVLALGFGRPGETVVLKQAIDWGVIHWDTSLVAAGGNSEKSIGEFLAKNPDTRKQLFIVSKESESKNADDLDKCLKTSLERLNTDYIDFYVGIYMMENPSQLTDDVRKWADSAKERGLIKYFGFSTHKNMPACLSAAAKAGWIDAIQTTYNFRVMQYPQMKDAVQACYDAGVGLIAMKTQGMRQGIETDADKKMVAHFLDKGFTEGQAKIKAVLSDERISTVCSSMSSSAMLMTNIAAVLDKTELTAKDLDVLEQYAQQTCTGYCAGCAEICEPVSAGVPVSDIMRAIMYHDACGDKDKARKLFAKIPAGIKQRLLSVDYSVAESRCPSHMPIAALIADAVIKLA